MKFSHKHTHTHINRHTHTHIHTFQLLRKSILDRLTGVKDLPVTAPDQMTLEPHTFQSKAQVVKNVVVSQAGPHLGEGKGASCRTGQLRHQEPLQLIDVLLRMQLRNAHLDVLVLVFLVSGFPDLSIHIQLPPLSERCEITSVMSCNRH